MIQTECMSGARDEGEWPHVRPVLTLLAGPPYDSAYELLNVQNQTWKRVGYIRDRNVSIESNIVFPSEETPSYNVSILCVPILLDSLDSDDVQQVRCMAQS